MKDYVVQYSKTTGGLLNVKSYRRPSRASASAQALAQSAPHIGVIAVVAKNLRELGMVIAPLCPELRRRR